MLSFLTPLGLIMPGKFTDWMSFTWPLLVASGETIGFQITLLLTVVVYIEYLQSSIPEFSKSFKAAFGNKFQLALSFAHLTHWQQPQPES